MKRPRPPKLTRADAMACRPRKAPFCGRTERDNGGAQVSVELARPGWLRMLAGGETYTKTYSLDAFGVEVYDACDGAATVKKICHAFARRHKVTIGEAEAAVTQFLKTLMTKGLVVMELDREAP